MNLFFLSGTSGYSQSAVQLDNCTRKQNPGARVGIPAQDLPAIFTFKETQGWQSLHILLGSTFFGGGGCHINFEIIFIVSY